jgi:NADH-quinone oxidoreductase subunit C
MATREQQMLEKLQRAFPGNSSIRLSLDLVVMDVQPAELIDVARRLHDDPALSFKQLSDLCGVDYATYGRDEWATDTESMASFSRAVNASSTGSLTFNTGLDLPALDRPRFVVAYHLLSLDHNVRVRLRCAASDDTMPVVPSITPVWNNANWYEREAFDLFGILFDGHPDLRRILTDYGFNGHPFRKDFPLIGNVEMRYDSVKERVVYEPVSIEPRVLVPRVIREDSRYNNAGVDYAAAAAAASQPVTKKDA